MSHTIEPGDVVRWNDTLTIGPVVCEVSQIVDGIVFFTGGTCAPMKAVTLIAKGLENVDRLSESNEQLRADRDRKWERIQQLERKLYD